MSALGESRRMSTSHLPCACGVQQRVLRVCRESEGRRRERSQLDGAGDELVVDRECRPWLLLPALNSGSSAPASTAGLDWSGDGRRVGAIFGRFPRLIIFSAAFSAEFPGIYFGAKSGCGVAICGGCCRRLVQCAPHRFSRWPRRFAHSLSPSAHARPSIVRLACVVSS